MLRERVISDHKDKWVLDGEDQLTGMVNAADKWFEEVRFSKGNTFRLNSEAYVVLCTAVFTISRMG